MDLFAHLNVYVPKRYKLKQLIASTGISPPALITAVAFAGATVIAVTTCYLKPTHDQGMSRDIDLDVNDINGIYPPSESQCSNCPCREGHDQEKEKIEANGEDKVKDEANGEDGVKDEANGEEELKNEITIEREFTNEAIIEEHGENEVIIEEEVNKVMLEEEAAEVREFLAYIESLGAEDVAMTPVEILKDETS